MFSKLQKKWKVSPLQLTLILFAFAIGGSATGFVSKKIMNILSIDTDWLWTLIYIFLVTIIWPLAVLIVSIFFGQFKFFSGYIRRMGMKMGFIKSADSEERTAIAPRSPFSVLNIAVFASGAGSNAEKIINHFASHPSIKVSLIVSNKPGAGVLNIAKANQVPTLIIEKEKFFRGNGYIDELKKKKIEFIVLAGFLWKIPTTLVKAYPKRIINIHPALLPKYGGKGMYGQWVHEAVLNAKEKESGITIHYVDEHYDNGDIILQVKCHVLENDTAETLAHRIHALEHANYPVIIEELLAGQLVY